MFWHSQRSLSIWTEWMYVNTQSTIFTVCSHISDNHRDLCQSEQNECMWTHVASSLLCVHTYCDWQRSLWVLKHINRVSVFSVILFVSFIWRPLYFFVRVSPFFPISVLSIFSYFPFRPGPWSKSVWIRWRCIIESDWFIFLYSSCFTSICIVLCFKYNFDISEIKTYLLTIPEWNLFHHFTYWILKAQM